MNKKMNNKGFSLVELIIVVAIMAVLIGVLAPAYLQYVEKSKKTADCSAIGSILDAYEVVAADPSVAWSATDAQTIEITSSSCTYTGTTAVVNAVTAIAKPDKARITGSWSNIKFTATKDSNGSVTFAIDASSTMKKTDASGSNGIDKISKALSERFE